MINQKIITLLLRIFVSVVFLFSAYSKLYPAEPFELYVFSLGVFDWFNSTLLVRLLIGVEAFIGLFLVLNIYSKQVIRFTIALLSVFTIYLFYIYFFNTNIHDCGCFGNKFELTPLQSIGKNFLLIAILIVLLLKNKSYQIGYKKVIFSTGLLFSLLIPFILSPPDGLINTEYKKKITKEKIDSEIIGDFEYNGENLSFKKGKAIVCFFSMYCPFCKMAAQKISIVLDNNNMNVPIYYIFYGDEESLPQFWEKSHSNKFPHKILETKLFFQYSGSSLPAIFFIEDEKVEKYVGYRGLDDEEIINFFDKK